MVTVRYAYRRGKTFIRRVSAVFAVLFGFIAIFFTGTPKLWSPEGSSQNPSAGFFTPDIAHADVPDCGGGPLDCSCEMCECMGCDDCGDCSSCEV